MRLVLIGMLLLLTGLWLPILAYSQSGGRPARSGARWRDPSAPDSHVQCIDRQSTRSPINGHRTAMNAAGRKLRREAVRGVT